MTGDPYQLVPFSPQYADQVAQVQQVLWGPDLARNQAYLEWKYLRNPFAPTPLIVLILLEGQVVGMRGLFATAWQAGPGDTPPSVWMCPADNVVHPDHRKQGLSKKSQPVLLEMAAGQGFHHFIGLSGSPISRDTWLKAGWKKLGEWNLAYRFSKPYSQAGRIDGLLSRLGLGSLPNPPRPGLFGWFDFNAEKYRARLGSIRVDTKPRPAAMAALAGALRSSDQITHLRTEPYYAWRYQNPLSEYRFLYWGEQDLEGYLVLQAPVAGKKPRVNVVDWAANDPRLLAELLQAALRLGAFEQVVVWSGLLNPSEQGAFQQAGFKFLASGKADQTDPAATSLYRPSLLVNSTCQDESWTIHSLPALDFSRWDLFGIFSDNF